MTTKQSATVSLHKKRKKVKGRKKKKNITRNKLIHKYSFRGRSWNEFKPPRNTMQRLLLV